MIKRLFNKNFFEAGPSRSVLSAAFVITVAGLASRFLGLLRDRFLASSFGAGDVLDVYYASFRIPDLIYNVLILGALSAAFIPVFTGLVSKNKEKEAWDLANGMLNLAIFFVAVVSIVACIFSPFIMKLIAPGFSSEKTEQAVAFTRIMFLSPLFLAISGIFGGVLTSFKRFLVYSLAPVFYNLGIIFGVLVLVRWMGPIGLAWGVVFGAFLHMLSQYPTVRKLGFRHASGLFSYFKNPEAREIFRLMIPRTLGIAAGQINLFVVTIFASTLAAGSLAIFTFANNLQSVPMGIFGASFAIAVFPTLAAYRAKGDDENFVKNFSETFRQILFFVIPISVFMLLLRAQMVRVVLGAGEFDWEDTVLTFECLGIFVLSLFAQSAIPLLARSFYAMRDTKTPFYIALLAEGTNILAILLLIERFQVLGLAMAFSFSSVLHMFVLLFFLRNRFENLDDGRIITSVIKITLASFGAGLGVQATKYAVNFFVNIDTFLGIFTQLVVAGGIGISLFIIISHILKLEEYLRFKKILTSRIFKGKKVIVEDTGEVSGV